MLAGIYRKAVITVGGNAALLRGMAFLWRSLPYPLRRLVTAGFIRFTLWEKRLLGVDKQNELTPMNELGSLAYWGVPELDIERFRLTIDGAVECPLSLSFEELEAEPPVERQVRMDCVGGFRNNSIMKGTRVAPLLGRAGVSPQARRAVFHCADGYYVSIELSELEEREAFLAYAINGQRLPRFGFPLRLAVPGKYGYQWAKWIVRVEAVTDDRKGYWARLGLPDRGDLGDVS